MSLIDMRKVTLGCLVLYFVLVANAVWADQIYRPNLATISGSGSIVSARSGIAYLTIDTTGPDSSGMLITSATMNTSEAIAGYTYFAYDYGQDSTDFVDTIQAVLKTAMIRGNIALAKTLYSTKLDTSDFIYFAWDNDTLVWNETWWEISVWDSTSDSAGTDYPQRVYQFDMGLQIRK